MTRTPLLRPTQLRALGWLALPFLVACGTEVGIGGGEKVPVAQPPGDDGDDLGSPPDWQNCLEGWRGQYSNLTADNKYVTPGPRIEVPTTVEGLALWDDPEYEQFDPSLDFGQNFWPMDEGLEEDPKYFAVYWHSWVRAWSGTTLSFLLGSSDDAFVYINGAPVAENPGIHGFVRTRYDIHLDAGQYPIEIWFAHRGSPDAAMSFRHVEGDVSFCYPDF
ncbi:MAG: hypothetical protein H6738_00055 [Alphaproteobacteria bacterium]|nr:hypothetical protein [Alphaproteobacteria bacterium]MCB9695162.1 hypothetical protein [Alphaproteobacteria bacterium]